HSAHHDLHSFPTRRSSDLYFEPVTRTHVMILSGVSFQEMLTLYCTAILGWAARKRNIPPKENFREIGDFVKKTRYESIYSSSFRSEEHTSELQSRENLVCR